MWLSSYLRYATLTAPGIYYKQNGDSQELSHFRSCTTWLVYVKTYALRGLAAPLNYQVTETISGQAFADLAAATMDLDLQNIHHQVFNPGVVVGKVVI